MGQLYEAIAREVRARGGEIMTGTRVRAVETLGDRVVAVLADGPSGPMRVPVGELLSTMPLTELVRALRPNAERSRDRLRFRALTFLNVMLAREDFSENTWMYVANGDLRMSRIQEPKRRSADMAPAGRTSLMLEIPCDVGDDVWRAGITELRARMGRELRRLGFSVDDVVDAFVVRVEHGYPVYHLGYERDRQALLDEVRRFANVRTAGRQGLFRYVFMDAAMQMGILAAQQMMRGERGGRGIDAIGRAAAPIVMTALTA
jgi:protoporphyrinogen oxidase